MQLRPLLLPTTALALLIVPRGAIAGPPFLTDDPEPTEVGHWEIYAPQVDGAGSGGVFEGALSAELNYGAATDLQLTVGLPADFSSGAGGARWGAGDIELSAKYRFVHDEAAGLSIAAFPGITVPTGSNGFGAGRVTAFLPVWAQKDFGKWSVFGGAGYAINPGADNRNFWQGGVALTRQVNQRLLLGVEADRQGADTVDGAASTSLGLGAIYQLKQPFRLLASGGPVFEDGAGLTGYHLFLALGLDF